MGGVSQISVCPYLTDVAVEGMVGLHRRWWNIIGAPPDRSDFNEELSGAKYLLTFCGCPRPGSLKTPFEGSVALISAGMGSKSSLVCDRWAHQFLST